MSGSGRCLALIVALFLLSFSLPRLLPGDPLTPLSAGNGQDVTVTLSDATRARLTRYYGLDQPLPVQFGHYLAETARGDLGFSISFNRPVAQLIRDRLPWTLLLIGPSLLLSAPLGCLLGGIAAYRNDRRGQRGVAAALLLLGALPEFVSGLLLILALGVWWPLLPAGGAATPFQTCAGPAGVLGCARDVITHATLPVLALTAAQLPAFFLLMRAAMLAELRQPYLLAARARGLGEFTLARRHAARPALLPVATLLGVRLGALLGGAVVVETLFAYPGLGRLAFQAALARDYPLIQSLFLLGGITIVLVNAAMDLLRWRLDPRLLIKAQA